VRLLLSVRKRCAAWAKFVDVASSSSIQLGPASVRKAENRVISLRASLELEWLTWAQGFKSRR